MLFNINKDIMEKWRWTNPRIYILIEIIKKYENKLEKGSIVVFQIEGLMKDFGYTPARHIRHKSFTQQIRSDITLLDPYKEDGGRLIFEFVKTKDRLNQEVFFKYIRPEEEKTRTESSTEPEIRDKGKIGNQSFSAPKYKPFYGPIENDRGENVIKAKTAGGREIEVDLFSLPDRIKKQIKEEINNG